MKKISNMFQSVSYWIGVMVIGVVVGISLQIASAAWTNPTGLPPNQNIDAPINIGSVLQRKAGSLAVDGPFLSVQNDGYFGGKVGIGTNYPDYLLHAVGTAAGENGIAIESAGVYTGIQIINSNYTTTPMSSNGRAAHIAWNNNDKTLEIGSDQSISLLSNTNSPVYGPDFCIKGTSNCLSSKTGGGGGTVPAPPTCTGSNKALQWNGSTWSCATISGSGGCAGSDIRQCSCGIFYCVTEHPDAWGPNSGSNWCAGQCYSP